MAVTANIVRVLSAEAASLRDLPQLTGVSKESISMALNAGVIRDVLRPLPLMAGTAPYPDGWRAKAPPPVTLPRFPMVLHRGGYPDGS